MKVVLLIMKTVFHPLQDKYQVESIQTLEKLIRLFSTYEHVHTNESALGKTSFTFSDLNHSRVNYPLKEMKKETAQLSIIYSLHH